MSPLAPTVIKPQLSLSEPALTALEAAFLIPAAVADPADRYEGDPRRRLVHLDDATYEAFAHLQGRSWPDMLGELVAPLDRIDIAVLGASLATTNPILQAETLTYGPVQRRLDAVLDVLDVQFSASDVQGTQESTKATLAEVQLPALLQGATLAVAFVGGAHGVLSAGRHAERGASWWASRTQLPTMLLDELASGLTQAMAALTASTEDLAKIVALDGRWLAELQRQQDVVAERRRGDSGALKAAGRQVQAITDAIRILRDTVPDGTLTFDQEMPDVIGHRLSDAKSLLALHGITPNSKDGTSSGRWIASDSNWRVTAQSPAAGTDAQAAMLTVLKWSE